MRIEKAVLILLLGFALGLLLLNVILESRRPRLLPAGALKGAAPVGKVARPPAWPKRVIVICVDTLRADHVSAFGYPRETTPNIDQMLAKEGIGFTAAHAPSSWTLPSSASLFTSLNVHTHRVENRKDTLHHRVPTVAGSFTRAGWWSAAFITHIYVSSLFGLDSGFREFIELSISWKFGEGRQLRAGALNEYVFDWLEENAKKPFYLYLHYFDPHWDYDAPSPYDRLFTDPDYMGPADGTWRYLQDYLPRTRRLSEESLEHIIALYDGEIAYTDYHLGELFRRLKNIGIWEETLLVLLSDHGEEFQEHGSVHHMRTLYEEVLRVPLIFKLPGGRPEGWRPLVDARVSTLDVGPTLLDLAGIEIPPTFQGRSLLPLMKAGGPDRNITARTVRFRSDKMALIASGKKLIAPFGRRRGPSELYDLDADPGERRSVAKRYREDAALLKEEIERMLTGHPEDSARPVRGSKAELSPEQREQLEALGYVGNE
jgi:arylsulfatase A-like enzyme